jgi:hypothetical protein
MTALRKDCLRVRSLPGGVQAWWSGLVKSGYPTFVPAYVLSAEFAVNRGRSNKSILLLPIAL